MIYTVLAYSYWTGFHDVYGCLSHAHQRYQLQLPYKSHRTYLPNHMGSISHHIMPLVINSLRVGHTHTCKHIHMHIRRHSQTEAILRNISGSFPQKWKFRSSCWKGRENNICIERKHIRPRIRSYSYVSLST